MTEFNPQVRLKKPEKQAGHPMNRRAIHDSTMNAAAYEHDEWERSRAAALLSRDSFSSDLESLQWARTVNSELMVS
jgi:hypothetical protein